MHEWKSVSQRSIQTTVFLAALLLGTIGIRAQQMPNPYGLSVSLENAKKAAASATAEARKIDVRMSIAVTDVGGELVYFEKMDGTQMASVMMAQGKARTAVMFRRPSKTFADQYAAGNTAFTTFTEQPVASEGGIPIVVSGKIIGAIGASGGTGQQDGMAAAAGGGAVK